MYKYYRYLVISIAVADEPLFFAEFDKCLRNDSILVSLKQHLWKEMEGVKINAYWTAATIAEVVHAKPLLKVEVAVTLTKIQQILLLW